MLGKLEVLEWLCDLSSLSFRIRLPFVFEFQYPIIERLYRLETYCLVGDTLHMRGTASTVLLDFKLTTLVSDCLYF